jgi:hypothetical protein
VNATNGDSYAGDCSAWEIESRADEGHWVVAAVITDVEAVREAGEANARLIAAAPELLDSLDPVNVREAAKLLAEAGHGLHAGLLILMADTQERAIAKATGGQP